MSPLGREMQKDVPSTRVMVPEPTGPAAVSAFHPAIPAPLSNQRPAPGLQRHAAARRRHVPSDATLACLPIPERAFSHEPREEEAQAARRSKCKLLTIPTVTYRLT